MKVVGKKNQLWLKRRWRSNSRFALWHANVTKRRQRTNKMMGRPTFVRLKTSIYKVPAHLMAERYENRSKIIDILRSALSVLESSQGKVRFDFSQVRRCYPGGMLMLIAFLELLVGFFPTRVSARCPPGSMSGQLLNHFGLGAKLGVSNTACAPKHESVVNWHYVTGTKLDGTKISELLRKYKQLAGAELPEGLYDVLGEALTNVHHHAYPEGANTPDALRRWWLFSRYDEPKEDEPGNLYIAVYDIGKGIQNTMKAKLQTGEMVLNLGSNLAELMGGSWKTLDRRLLEKAVDHERSSTGLANRGKGLPEMREFIRSNESGLLNIISGFSQYSSNIKNGTPVVSWPSEILGTLILWSIPLYKDGVKI